MIRSYGTSVWFLQKAKLIWGIWWTRDARLTSSLFLRPNYIAYLLVRNYATEESRVAGFAAVLRIVGFINVPIVLPAFNLWRTQHTATLIFERGLTSSMLLTSPVSIAAFTTLYIALILQNISLKGPGIEIKQVKHIKNEQGEEWIWKTWAISSEHIYHHLGCYLWVHASNAAKAKKVI